MAHAPRSAAGAGSRARVAAALGRHAVSIELNPTYVEISKRLVAPVAAQGLLDLQQGREAAE